MLTNKDDFFNTDGTITISGIDFDNPLSSDLRKFEFREYKEGVKTTIREFWLERHILENGAYSVDRHLLSITNRGVCRLDGSQLSGEDAKKVKFLFENIRVEK